MADVGKVNTKALDDIGKINLMDVPVGVDVSDADAAVGDVKDPKTFYSVAAPRKTGTMPTVAIVAGSSAYPAGYHVGNVGGLEAIDPDLTPAKIKKDEVIFGKTGTYVSSLAEDTKGAGEEIGETTTANEFPSDYVNIEGGADLDIASVTPTFADCKAIIGFSTESLRAYTANNVKARLLVGGVQQAESGFLATGPTLNVNPEQLLVCMDVNGATNLKCQIHNYDASAKGFLFCGLSLLYGSIKIA